MHSFFSMILSSKIILNTVLLMKFELCANYDCNYGYCLICVNRLRSVFKCTVSIIYSNIQIAQ